MSPSPSRSTVAHEISLTVGPHDDDFQSPSKSKSQETTTNIADSHFHSNVEPPEFQDEEEKFSFAQVIDEIFNILPEEKFPRKETGTEDNPRPKSSIESEMVKEKRKSISLPQSALIVDRINFIQNQLKLSNKFFTENWLPTTKDNSALANLKYYQAHAEKFMTSSATPLDNDASKLNLSLNGNYQIPIKSLDMYGGNSTGNSRFLLSDFPCSKKEWKTQADHRSIHSKQICFCPDVSGWKHRGK